MIPAALGFKPRTGRAVLVAVAGGAEPRVIDRAEIALLPPGEMAPYHAAEHLPTAAARDRHVNGAVARAQKLARKAVEDAAKRCAVAGYKVKAIGILVGTGMPQWTTEEILAVHIRMHKAEGEMFRDLLVEVSRARGMEPVTLPDKTALDAAAKELRVTRAKLDARLAALGGSAGPPWGRYQKEAAAAALVALAT